MLRTQQKQERDNFHESHLSLVFGSSSNTLLVIALALLVIPAVEEVVLVYLKHSKRCAIFAVCAHITLTDELTC